jgi:hypothetical protein
VARPGSGGESMPYPTGFFRAMKLKMSIGPRLGRRQRRFRGGAEIGAAGRALQDSLRVFQWTLKFEFRQTDSGSWIEH